MHLFPSRPHVPSVCPSLPLVHFTALPPSNPRYQPGPLLSFDGDVSKLDRFLQTKIDGSLFLTCTFPLFPPTVLDRMMLRLVYGYIHSHAGQSKRLFVEGTYGVTHGSQMRIGMP